ncbi:MAG: CocE/NonD family hydrolase [Acidimicrobiia bacterium]
MSEVYHVSIDRKVFVPMADGTRIALTVYLPDAPNDGPFPTVVESVPYRKDDAFHSADWRTYAHLAREGFAGVRIDIRGTGASTGIIVDEYTPREQEDTLEVLRWIEDQPWSTGRLGMWGVSWGGFSALQTAMLRPPQLKAIAPVHATHDRFACDVHYTGGSLHAQEQVDWPTSMVVCNALPPDPDIFGDGWFEEWMRRLEGTPQWPATWLRHQVKDDYWLHGSPCADYDAIECPTLLIGGWLDGYVDGMLALAQNLKCDRRTIIGPWGHYRPATGVPAPTFDHFHLLSRWFGHHLRGDDNGVMDLPIATVFVRDQPPYDSDRVAGHWRGEHSWPPKDAKTVVMGLDQLDHDALSWSGPQWVGRHAPAWDRGGIGSTGSAEDDAVSMTFETSPLDQRMEILGTPEVNLAIGSNRNVGMVAARLLAIDPRGESHLITRGSRNLAISNDLSQVRAPEPDRVDEVTIPLMATSAVIPEGWIIRLAVAGADFPVVWPPGQTFTLRIDPAQSTLLLPTVPPRSPSSILSWPEAKSIPIPPSETIRSERHSGWEHRGGVTTYTRSLVDTELLPERGNLTVDSAQTWAVSVGDVDPATTRAWSEATAGLSRPGWLAAATGRLELTADADDFYLSIELTATLNGVEIFAKQWDDTVQRGPA